MPYKLFLALLGGSHVEDIANVPECCRDELSAGLLARYPTQQELLGSECQAVLAAIALVSQVDVAAVEAGHSTNREFSSVRSRGWSPSLETLSSKYVLQRTASWQPAGKRSKAAGSRQSSKARRGGGGAWRAYCHQHLKGTGGLGGERFSARVRQLSQQYRSLSPQERAVYEAVGAGATLTHKHGFPSFGKLERGVRPPRNLQVGDVRADGAVVAADVPEAELFDRSSILAFSDRYERHRQGIVVADDPCKLSRAEEDAVKRVKDAGLQEPLWDQTSATCSRLCTNTEHYAGQSKGFKAAVWTPPTGAASKARAARALCLPLL